MPPYTNVICRASRECGVGLGSQLEEEEGCAQPSLRTALLLFTLTTHLPLRRPDTTPLSTMQDQLVTRAQLKALLANNSSGALLLDLRSVGECKVEPGIPGATNIPCASPLPPPHCGSLFLSRSGPPLGWVLRLT
jgi:hypothetical protein